MRSSADDEDPFTSSVDNAQKGKRRRRSTDDEDPFTPTTDDEFPQTRDRNKKQRIESGVDEAKSPPSTPVANIIYQSDNGQFSSPSTLSKQSTGSGPSPSSIISKLHFKYVELDAKDSQSLSAVTSDGKEGQIEQGSMALMVAEQRSELYETGVIYKTIRDQHGNIVNRLKDLCNVKERTSKVGIEMADAACLLKLVSSSSADKIESVEKKALRAAMFLLEAEKLRNIGQQLLLESQNSFRDALQ